MSIVRGVDETGESAFYDVPDTDLPKYKLNAKPFDDLSDDEKRELLNGDTELTKDNAHGAIPIGPASGGGDTEGFQRICWVYIWDHHGNWYYHQNPC